MSREEQAVRMRNNGATYTTIAYALGVSTHTARILASNSTTGALPKFGAVRKPPAPVSHVAMAAESDVSRRIRLQIERLERTVVRINEKLAEVES